MKTRSLWQILVFYAAASWVVLQVVDVVKDNLGLPDWVAVALSAKFVRSVSPMKVSSMTRLTVLVSTSQMTRYV